jgi:hypothetical protein
MIISRSCLLRIRIFRRKFEEKIKVHVLRSISFFFFFFFFNRAAYEIMWKNMEEPDRPKMTRHMRIACWITKATHTHTHTHSEYVTLITFPRQQWLYEHTSMLRFFLVFIISFDMLSTVSCTSSSA